VGWLSSKRGLSQIWLQVGKEFFFLNLGIVEFVGSMLKTYSLNMANSKTDFVEICIIVFAIFSLFVVKLWQLKISKRKLDFSTLKFLI
jgi:hypothetical protein